MALAFVEAAVEWVVVADFSVVGVVEAARFLVVG